MEKIIIYRAFDGEKFDSEEECLDYENKIAHIPSSIHFKNIDGEDYVCSTPEEVESAYQGCSYIKIDNTPSWKEDIDFLYSYYGFCINEPTPGLYQYNWESYEWEVIIK